MPHVDIATLREHVIPSGRWRKLNEPLGLTAFGLNAMDCDPGETFEIEHDERASGQQEAYVVLAGRAEFRVADETVEAWPGVVVALPDPTHVRSWRALEPGTRVLCIGAEPASTPHDFGAWIDREAEGQG
jgi:uncharacterized cupin superfamily protein